MNASWLRARFESYINPDPQRPAGDGSTFDPVTGQPAFNLRGKALPQAPNYSVNVAAEYVVHFDRSKVTFRGESEWVDRVFFTPFNVPEVSQPAYSVQNAFVTFDPGDDHWRLSLYVKNIADKTILASGQAATPFVGSPVVGFVKPPRTFGATLGYRF